jgi:arabinose-5-phosphate isomerase
VIVEITQKRLGTTAVVNETGLLQGIITDGDLRRMLEANDEYSNIKAKDIMGKSPKTIEPGALAVDALDMMRKNNISQLIVTENGQYLGVIHLHDIIREGLV